MILPVRHATAKGMRRLCVGLFVSLSAVILGCTPDWGLHSICDHPNPYHQDVDGTYVPCNGAEDWCRCALKVGTDWLGPTLAWIGPEADAPTCSAMALGDDWEGYSGLTPAPECGTCKCAPPVGSCRLPLQFTAHAAPGCPATGATQTSFNAQDPWDGSCTTDNGISAGKMCGNEPCVQSLSVEPIVVVEQTACTKVDPPPALGTGNPWQGFGRICTVTEAGTCRGYDSLCLRFPHLRPSQGRA